MTLDEIYTSLSNMMRQHLPPLRINKDTEERLSLSGTKERMQGAKKVDGYYFGEIVRKPKDIRLYFFPIYTHVGEFENISPALRKCLKGKSCFHIKKMDEELEREIDEMISKGVQTYLDHDLI